uniref:very-long-chain 3-oxoacyl-CoA synthase n=1 Tax=Kalanchoe fedtschenkoi TaxID=63787 RepID=A0A7N0TW56_KALFE
MSHLQILGDYLIYQPQIQNFQWNPATTLGGSPMFLAAAVAGYLSTTFVFSRLLTPALPSALLRLISAAHNLVLLILSLLMSLGVTLASTSSLPASHLFCFPAANPPRQGGPLFFWAHVYYLSKLLEFVDTLIIILNRTSARRLTFLHVYHHSAVVVMSYLWLATSMSLFPIALVTNAAVHVLMYGYYLLCAVGIRPGWKRVVTDCQIVQFVFGFAASFVMLFYHFCRGGCAGIWGWVFNAVFNASLLYLFVDFHKRNYAAKRKMAAAGKQS